LFHQNNSTFRLRIDKKFYDISTIKIDSEKIAVTIDGYTYEAQVRTALQEKANKVIEQTGSAHHTKDVKAPMPGMILKIKHQSGDKINNGDSVIILEAMKMENDIKSPSTGIIKEIFVKEGTPVEKGAKLFAIE
jgi:biotin carboxyl carrier protein